MTYNTNHKIYNVDDNYFKTWTADMTYIVGYIYADGNLDKSKYRLRISSIDEQILNDINKRLNSNRKLMLERNTNNKSWYTLTIDNKNIYEDLLSIGVTPNKSKTATIIKDIPKEYRYDFLRGYFDGDGCVYAEYHKDSVIPSLCIDICTGSREIVFILSGIINELTDKMHRISVKQRKDGLWILSMKSILSERIYNRMYYDNCLCLERKKKKFDIILDERNKNRKKKLSKCHKV